MATFQVRGLHAVNDFFGQDSPSGIAKQEKSTRREDGDLSRQKVQLGRKFGSDRRSGVGTLAKAAVEEKRHGELSNDDAKRIFRVGRKRGRDDESDENENHDNDDDADSGRQKHGSEDDDDSGGRSAAVQEKKRTVELLPNPSMLTNKSRKKKKTTTKVKTEEETGDVGTVIDNSKHWTGIPAESSPKQGDANEKSTCVAAGNDDSKNNMNSSSTTTKRRRKKVRSRQKNVRKDNRALRDRPVHLIPGRSEFTGRPLTAETRQRLGMGESRTTQWKQSLILEGQQDKTHPSGGKNNVEAVASKTNGGDNATQVEKEGGMAVEAHTNELPEKAGVDTVLSTQGIGKRLPKTRKTTGLIRTKAKPKNLRHSSGRA